MKGLAIFWFPEIALAAFVASLVFEFADYSHDDFFLGIAILPVVVARVLIYLFFGLYWISAVRVLGQSSKIAKKFALYGSCATLVVIVLGETFRDTLALTHTISTIRIYTAYPEQFGQFSYRDYPGWFHRLSTGQIALQELAFFGLLTWYTIWMGRVTKGKRLLEWAAFIFFLGFAFFTPFLANLIDWDYDFFIYGVSSGSIPFQFFPVTTYLGVVSTFIIFVYTLAFRLAAGRIIIEPNRRSPYYSPPTSGALSDSTP